MMLHSQGNSVLSYHTKIVVWAIKTTEAHKARRISPVGVWPTLACSINRQGSKRMIDKPRAMAQLGLIHSSCKEKWIYQETLFSSSNTFFE